MSDVPISLGASNSVSLANEAALAASASLRAKRDELHATINKARTELAALSAKILRVEREAYQAKIRGS